MMSFSLLYIYKKSSSVLIVKIYASTMPLIIFPLAMSTNRSKMGHHESAYRNLWPISEWAAARGSREGKSVLVVVGCLHEEQEKSSANQLAMGAGRVQAAPVVPK